MIAPSERNGEPEPDEDDSGVELEEADEPQPEEADPGMEEE